MLCGKDWDNFLVDTHNMWVTNMHLIPSILNIHLLQISQAMLKMFAIKSRLLTPDEFSAWTFPTSENIDGQKLVLCTFQVHACIVESAWISEASLRFSLLSLYFTSYFLALFSPSLSLIRPLLPDYFFYSSNHSLYPHIEFGLSIQITHAIALFFILL